MSEPASKRARTDDAPVAQEIAADLAECSKQLSAKIREVKESKAKVAKVRPPLLFHLV